MAEGAAVLVLEELERARARGARIYAEIVGYGASNDAYHIARRTRSRSASIAMMRDALERRRHARRTRSTTSTRTAPSTPYNDAAETQAIKQVFGDHAYRIAISSNKSMIGHLFGAAGAVEALATALAIHHGVIPPTINLHHPDPECDLDYVPNVARTAEVRTGLSNSMGLGGHNACLILRRVE